MGAEFISTFSSVWKGLIIVPCMMLVFNIWVVTGFILHAKKTSILKKKSRRDMNGGIIFKTAMAAEIISLFRYSTTIAIYIVGLDYNAHFGCQTIVYINNVFFVAPIVAMYTFLWTRQRAFYQHPSLGGLFNRSVSILSKLSLILIAALVISSLAYEIASNRYLSSQVGCKFATHKANNQIRFIIYGAVLAIGQAMMLGLFIHPLHVHSKTQKRLNSNGENIQADPSVPSDNNCESTQINNQLVTQYSEVAVTPIMNTKRPHPQLNENNNANGTEYSQKSLPDNTTAPARKPRKESRVFGLIRRVLVLACISIASDLTAMGVSGFLVMGTTPYYVMALFLDMDTTVNVVTVLLSFKAWREILLGGLERLSCFSACATRQRTQSFDSRTSREGV